VNMIKEEYDMIEYYLFIYLFILYLL